ncbi:MAG TPA: hypothetical protein PLJ78_15435 [Anaerolineae bacterium]|nr:hypothetical protein [Anaerolineae bacterium]HQK15325.1 hypothetical protein [Anaerolineae bacterium]
MAFFNLFSKKKRPSTKNQQTVGKGGVLGYLGLTDWFGKLPREMRDKVSQYSGEGQHLTDGQIVYSSLTQRKFFWTCAENAIYAKDFETAIFLAQQGITAQGDWVDLHFVYSTLIEAYEKLENWTEAKRYCLEELKQFEFIGPPLKKDMGGELPPGIRCRDTLLDILVDEGDVEEVKRVFHLFVEKKMMSVSKAEELSKKVLLDIKEQQVAKALESEDTETALALTAAVIKKDERRAPRLYKSIGDFFLAHGDKQNAFDYLSKALAADPTISGVKRNLQRLAKELNTEVQHSDEQIISVLKQREPTATEWWSKRDLANEYVKVKCYDDAWRLFNQAINLRLQAGGTCDTIYPYMAKMREKEGNFLDALMLYLFGYRELLRSGVNNPPQYVKQGIDRCLKKIGRQDLDHTAMFALAEKTNDLGALQQAITQLKK